MRRKEADTSSQNILQIDRKRNRSNNYSGIEDLNNCWNEGPEALTGPGRALARGPGCALLDPLPPQSEYVKSFFAKRRLPQQRRVHSRISWGLLLPGRYIFATFTNVGKGKKQLTNFRKIKWWLKRHYPGISGCRVFTDEGGGVIHIVIRMGMKQKRIDKEELDLYLIEKAGCGFCDLKRVTNKKGLADYLADQRAHNGMAREMAHQTQMTKYNYFGEWLPPGWIKKFRRAWFRTMGMHPEDRRVWFTKWLFDYVKDPHCWVPDRPVEWDQSVGWVMMDQAAIAWNISGCGLKPTFEAREPSSAQPSGRRHIVSRPGVIP